MSTNTPPARLSAPAAERLPTCARPHHPRLICHVPKRSGAHRVRRPRAVHRQRVEESVPPFCAARAGWLTAEYGMLPRATHTRSPREAAKGKQERLHPGDPAPHRRSLRAVVDMQALGERQITIDCDVLQADGGARTASITGALRGCP